MVHIWNTIRQTFKKFISIFFPLNYLVEPSFSFTELDSLHHGMVAVSGTSFGRIWQCHLQPLMHIMGGKRKTVIPVIHYQVKIN